MFQRYRIDKFEYILFIQFIYTIKFLNLALSSIAHAGHFGKFRKKWDFKSEDCSAVNTNSVFKPGSGFEKAGFGF